MTTTVAGLTITALLLRMLGQARYGTLAFGLSTVVLLAVVAQLGLGTAAMQRISSLDESGDVDGVVAIVRGAVTVIACASVLAGVVVVVVQLAFSHLTAGDALIVGAGLSALLIGTNLAMTASFTARGLGRFVLSEVPPVGVILLQLSSVLALRTASLSTETDVAVAYGAVGLVAAALGVLVLRSMVPAIVFVPRRRTALDVLRISIPFAVAGLALQAIAQADVFALGLVRAPVELARYEPVVRILDRVMLLVPMLLLAGFVPIASRIWTRRDAPAFRAFFVSASKAGFILSMPAILFLAAFPAVLPHALFGADFPVSAPVVRILLVGYIINVAFGLNTGALVAAGDAGQLRHPYLWTFLVMTVLAATLTPPFGAEGAALATTGSYLFLNVAVSEVLLRTTGLHLIDRGYVGVVISGLLLAGGLATAMHRDPGLPVAAGVTFVAWIVWVGVVGALGWLSRRDVAVFVPVRVIEP